MAKCDNLFKTFNSTIKLSEEKRKLLMEVRDDLRGRMRANFLTLPKEQRNELKLEFQTQGSLIMDTIINPKDDDFDVDDGVYFIGEQEKNERPTTQNFHDWVKYSVGESDRYGKVTDKDTCVRVAYVKEGFHVDLPIYYLILKRDPELAHLKEDWPISNPVEFIGWFEERAESGFQKAYILEAAQRDEYEHWLSDIRKKDVQIRRLVRYMKAWGDHFDDANNPDKKMPPGVAMTILVGENYVANELDDVALRDTLIAIKNFLKENNIKCPRPTAPEDEDLFKGYSKAKKDNFMNKLDAFIISANQAIANPNQKEACLKWQHHLGGRFPCSLAKDEVEGAQTFAKPTVISRENAKSA